MAGLRSRLVGVDKFDNNQQAKHELMRGSVMTCLRLISIRCRLQAWREIFCFSCERSAHKTK